MHVTADFASAEDLVQDAVLAALRHWPAEGIPERPDAWLFTVARRRGLDVLRREHNYVAKLAQLQWPVRPEPDDRLRPDHSADRPSVPRARNNDGATDHPRQTEDHRGANSVPDSRP